MDGTSKTERADYWIAVAVERISSIRERWQLTSDCSFAQKILINRRTAKKFHHSCKDRSVDFETVLSIFVRLIVSIPSQDWSKERCRKEKESIQADMLAVIIAKKSLPDELLARLSNSIDNELYVSGNDEV